MMILPLLSQVFAFNFNLKVLMCNFFLLENGVVVNLIIGVGFALYFGFWVVWKLDFWYEEWNEVVKIFVSAGDMMKY